MIIAPYQSRFSVRELPWLTFLLIVANLVVYFGLQARDGRVLADAISQYQASSLPRIEIPRYQAWLQQRLDAEATRALQALRTASETDRPAIAARLIQADAAFQRALRDGDIVRSDELVHQQWQRERTRFEAQWQSAIVQLFQLERRGDEPWRLLTHAFVHPSAAFLFGNLLVLLLAGTFAEVALGRARFLLAYLLGALGGGVFQLAAFALPWSGAGGAVAGAVAMVIVLFGLRRVPTLIGVPGWARSLTLSPTALVVPVWVAREGLQVLAAGGEPVALGAHVGGLVVGGLAAWLLRWRDPRREARLQKAAQMPHERRADQRGALKRRAQEAAARLDHRRATQLYRQLVEESPDDGEALLAYFNIALTGHDPDALTDAALRILWVKSKTTADQLRRTYVQMSQPAVLRALPVDEQLRLARRLVRSREDANALRVLDGILGDNNLRTLYARQTADCLLGLFTTYTRYGLKQQAEQVKQRLARYFPTPTSIGGLAPNTLPPATIRATTRGSGPNSTLRGPDTLHIDLSQ